MDEKKSCQTEGKAETCEACGEKFSCTPMGDCWCFSETVPQEALTAINERFERCLCRQCLTKAAQAAQA